MNTVHIIGNLGRAVELRELGGGKVVGKTLVAVSGMREGERGGADGVPIALGGRQAGAAGQEPAKGAGGGGAGGRHRDGGAGGGRRAGPRGVVAERRAAECGAGTPARGGRRAGRGPGSEAVRVGARETRAGGRVRERVRGGLAGGASVR